MDITGYAETEEKFISNIRKNSLGTKLCFPEVWSNKEKFCKRD